MTAVWWALRVWLAHANLAQWLSYIKACVLDYCVNIRCSYQQENNRHTLFIGSILDFFFQAKPLSYFLSIIPFAQPNLFSSSVPSCSSNLHPEMLLQSSRRFLPSEAMQCSWMYVLPLFCGCGKRNGFFRITGYYPVELWIVHPTFIRLLSK